MSYKKFDPISFLDIFEIKSCESLPKWYQVFAKMIEQREISVLKHKRKFKLKRQDQPLEQLISNHQNFYEQE